LWGFANGHLASVVRDAEATYLWELTILDGNGRAISDTPNRLEVIRSLTPNDVRRMLRQIEKFR
jgi:hypothetical protein